LLTKRKNWIWAIKLSRYTVILDACVLYPAPLRDVLLELATTDLFRAKWTDQIHDEWTSALLRQRPDIDKVTLDRTRNLMNETVLDCKVTNYEELIDGLNLPDENDRHVLAAAIAGKADAIITYNLKDFPDDYCNNYDLEILHPDDFLKFQYGFEPSIIVTAIRNIRQRLKKPTKSGSDYLVTLERQALPKIVSELKKFEAMI